jgi:hypothetical protein
MRLWAEALDIAHGTRMKLISIEKLCRGVTAFGGLARDAFEGASERHQNAAVRRKCQMVITCDLATQGGLIAACGSGGSIMKFLNWFRAKEPTPEITFTTQIVVNTAKPRTDLPEFCIEDFGEIIDLRPFAIEVLADYPELVPIEVESLARFAVRRHLGKYIKVAEYPQGVDREIIKELYYRVNRWARWPRQTAQNKAYVGSYYPMRKFRCDEHACPAAIAMQGTVVKPADQRRMPLNGCWGYTCHCTYRLVKRDGSVY